MEFDPFAKSELPPRQLHLREERIGVDMGQSASLPILFGPLECAGAIDEQISRLDHLVSFPVGKPKPPGLPLNMVSPLLRQPVTRHDAGVVFDVAGTVFAQAALDWVVGSLSRGLGIAHLVAE